MSSLILFSLTCCWAALVVVAARAASIHGSHLFRARLATFISLLAVVFGGAVLAAEHYVNSFAAGVARASYSEFS